MVTISGMSTHTDTLASMAVAPIGAGMMVGLGTGRAASRAIRALAARAAAEGLSVRCVATSDASAVLARSLGLHVVDFAGVERVDYIFDGADEVDEALRMLKGRGGAMTREKIVARAASRRVYLIDESKLVRRLGEKFPLPVEVLPFAMGAVQAALGRTGLRAAVREEEGGGAYVTDNGCAVLDVALGEGMEPEGVDALLNDTPGVIGHGLFLDEADEVLIENSAGSVERRTRV
ncbi:MAG: ribose-5-phosphate isomerase RpiA [Phycisphaerales bacterium]|nr:MAG: ribose-5-phosphate isomerase RpiA [Phycisphaerales bacterium]